MVYEIALLNNPDQVFTCTIPVNGKNIKLTLRVRYNTVAGYWTMAIIDSNDNLLIDNLPLLVSNYPANNLLEQYSYLGIGRVSLYPLSSNLSAMPDDTNLNQYVLLWGDNIV